MCGVFLTTFYKGSCHLKTKLLFVFLHGLHPPVQCRVEVVGDGVLTLFLILKPKYRLTIKCNINYRFSHKCSLLCESVKSPSCVRLFATPKTVARQAPLSMEFSMQEYWSGLPFPSPANLPHSGIEPWSPALQAGSLLFESPLL